jgi:hypothetical protein
MAIKGVPMSSHQLSDADIAAVKEVREIRSLNGGPRVETCEKAFASHGATLRLQC